MRKITIFVALFLSLFAYNTVLADTSFSGVISGDVTWTKANGPYIVNYVSIPAGASLTIEPGTVIKVVDNSYPFIVDGTLTIGSVGGEQVVVTSMKDDTVGGDSNGDGAATTPQAGDWREMTFNSGSTGNITNTTIRYGGSSVYNAWTGGYFNFPLIDNKGGTLTFANVVLAKSGNNALEQSTGTTTITNSTISNLARGVMNYGGSLTIGNNTFSNLGDYGISVYAATNFTNNGGNTGGRGMYMAYSIAGNQTWAKDNIPYVANSISISSGSSLTIAPGAIVKAMTDTFPFYIDGTLIIGSPTATENAIITSIKDDTVGGDTNNDGSATTPQAGDWRKVTMNAGASVTVAHATIKYGGATPYNYWTGGYFTYPLIENNGGILAVDHSDLAHSGYFGILQSTGTTTVINSSFANIAKQGINSAAGYLNVASTIFDTMERGIESTGGALEISGDTFTNTSQYSIALEGSPTAFTNHGGNSGTKGLFISETIAGAQTLPKDGLVYVVDYLSVPQGSTLAILPGAIMKIPVNGNPFTIDGTLVVGSSSSSEKTYITSMNDDTVGGDTNGDATSTTPNSGDWRTITFNLGSQATINNTVIRYGGASPYNSWTGGADWLPAIKNNGGTLLFDHATLTNNGNFGILQLSGTTTITNSEVAHTGRYGIWITGGMLLVNDSSVHDNATYGIYNGSTNIIDATDNWWGSETGPMHSSNPFGAGDKVSDYVDFSNWTGSDPTAGCVINCNSNVLFLPGLEASRLYRPTRTGETGIEKQLWEPSSDADVEDLFLDTNGKQPSPWLSTSQIYTKDVIDEAYVNNAGPNIYKSFLTMLDQMKNADHSIADYAAVPYDWRLSLEDVLAGGTKTGDHISYLETSSDPHIASELRRLVASSRNGKVTIVAHSNGGLVAKLLLKQLADNNDPLLAHVDKLVLVASPQLGTPEAVGALLFGTNQGIPASAPILLSPATARAFGENSPGANNLLPSPAYFGVVHDSAHPLISFDSSPELSAYRSLYGQAVGNGNELHDFLLGYEGRLKPNADDVSKPNVLNPTIVDATALTHANIDGWMPPESMQVYQIAGWGNETLAGFKFWMEPNFGGFGTHPTYTPDIVEDGDGTVVVPSALAVASGVNTGRWWVNLKDYNKPVFGVNRDHKDILEIDSLLKFIEDNLKDKDTSDLTKYAFISNSTPNNANESHRLRYILHSPLSLDLYDNLGNHTGISTTTGMIESGIPDAYYREFGEVKYISASASTTLHLVMNGQASGVFSLEVSEVDGDITVASTTFLSIPTSTSAKVTMDFTDGTIANASNLDIDEDGNGTIDFSLAPKVGEMVMLPKPKITVTANNKTMILAATLPVFTAVLSGFQNSDTASTSVTGAPSCSTTATQNSPIGTYSIVCTIGTLASVKYDFTFAPGTLAIIYNWQGFNQPINDTAYHGTQALSVFKGGSTIPVKFQLMNASGTTLQASSAPLWLQPQKGSAMSVAVDESTYSDPATSGTTFKWDATSQQYIYNWSTKGLTVGYWYRISAKLEDGAMQSVTVGIR